MGLSEEEKRDFLDWGRSESIQRDFRIMEENVRSHPVNVARYLEFLTGFSRLCGQPSAPTPPVDYTKVLI